MGNTASYNKCICPNIRNKQKESRRNWNIL